VLAVCVGLNLSSFPAPPSARGQRTGLNEVAGNPRPVTESQNVWGWKGPLWVI